MIENKISTDMNRQWMQIRISFNNTFVKYFENMVWKICIKENVMKYGIHSYFENIFNISNKFYPFNLAVKILTFIFSVSSKWNNWRLRKLHLSVLQHEL